MFGKEKGPTRKGHTEHAEQARRELRGLVGSSGNLEAIGKANVHATLAVYTLLSERLPAPQPKSQE